MCDEVKSFFQEMAEGLVVLSINLFAALVAKIAGELVAAVLADSFSLHVGLSLGY